MKANLHKLIDMGRAALIALVLLSFTIGFSACAKDPVTNSYSKIGYSPNADDDTSNPVFTDGVLNVPAEGWKVVEDLKEVDKKTWFNFHSDYPTWNVEVEYLFDKELDWITVWPKNGTDDGRFYIRVATNSDTPYVREAIVYVKSGGNTLDSFKVRQEAVAPKLSLGMEGLTRLTFSNQPSEKTAILNTNVIWNAEIIANSDPDNDWLEFGEFTKTTQNFSVKENKGSGERTATVRFKMAGGAGEIFTDLNIKQRDASTSPQFATLKTISQILAETGPTGGEIAGNVYIEGYVISDLSTRNFDVKRRWTVTDPNVKFDAAVDYDTKLMWVQDDSNKGLMFEWLAGMYNTYPLNTKVKIHLVDCTVVVDGWTGCLKIGSVEPDAVFESAESDGVTPVKLTSLDNIADYENTLVTISPVQFAIPYGTYVNIDERGFNTQFTTTSTTGTSWAVPYCETSRQYGHQIMDKNGNTIRLMSECTFTERYARMMPEGSGDLTAIVTRHYLANKNEYVLRLRRDSDNEVSDDASTRISNVVSRFGPWIQTGVNMTEIKANDGNGSLRTSVYTSFTANSSTGVYWSYTYGRVEPTTIVIDQDGVQTPAVAQDNDNLTETVYSCLNSNQMWNSAYASIITEPKLGGWFFTLSTKDVAADSQMVLSFDTSSSGSGPAWMRLQWLEIVDENDLYKPKNEWNTLVERYEIGHWDINQHLQQYSYKLPKAMNGKNKIVIRHITDFDGSKDNERASRNGSATGSGGTNRIGSWRIEEI